MKLENQVCSLELAKRLKELGVKQDSYFWWSNCKISFIMEEGNEGNVYVGATNEGFKVLDSECIPDDIVYSKEDTVSVNDRELYSAFTVGELLELIPGNFNGNYLVLQKGLMGNRYFCSSRTIQHDTLVKRLEDKTSADCLAKMLVYLLENKLI